MNRILIAAGLLLAPAAANAATREWHPAQFDRIELSGSWDVEVVQGPAGSVRAEGDADTLARMEVRVDGDGLHIGTKRGDWSSGGWHRDRVHVTVVAPMPLRAARVTGSGNMGIARVETPRFAGSVAGSGNMALMSVAAREVALSIAGSGNVRAAGRAQRVTTSIAGSGDVRIGDLHAADQGSVATAERNGAALILFARLVRRGIEKLARAIGHDLDRARTRRAIDVHVEDAEEDRNPRQRLVTKTKLSWRHGLHDHLHQSVGRGDQDAVFLRHAARRIAEEVDRPGQHQHQRPEQPRLPRQGAEEGEAREDGDEAPSVLEDRNEEIGQHVSLPWEG